MGRLKSSGAKTAQDEQRTTRFYVSSIQRDEYRHEDLVDVGSSEHKPNSTFLHVHVRHHSSRSEALAGFSLSSCFSVPFCSRYHPRAPSLSGRIGCEKW